MPKIMRILIGVFLIVIGIPIFILPIPFGLIMIGIGAAMVWGQNVASISTMIKEKKSAHPSFSRFVDGLKNICPIFVRRWLKEYDL